MNSNWPLLISANFGVAILSALFSYIIIQQRYRRSELLGFPRSIAKNKGYYPYMLLSSLIPVLNLFLLLFSVIEAVSGSKLNRHLNSPSFRSVYQLKTIRKILRNEEYDQKFDFKKRIETHLLVYLIDRAENELKKTDVFPPPELKFRKKEALAFLEKHSEEIGSFYHITIEAYALSPDACVEVLEMYFSKNNDFFERIRLLKQNDPFLLEEQSHLHQQQQLEEDKKRALLNKINET